MALIPHPHYTLEDEGDDSTLPPPLVLKSKFRIKRPCWEPWLPLWSGRKERGVPHRQASGRNHCSSDGQVPYGTLTHVKSSGIVLASWSHEKYLALM